MKGFSLFGVAPICALILIGNEIAAKKSGLKSQHTEMKMLKEFREMIDADSLTKEFMKTDAYLLRWLRSAHFNLESTKDKFDQAMKWRADNNVDSILDDSELNEVIRNPFYIIDGTSDKHGRPIVRIEIKKLDTRKFAVSGQSKLFEEIMIQLFEKSEEQIYKMTTLNSTQSDGKAIIVEDLSGYNLKQHGCLACVPLYTGLAGTMENYYPGLYKMVLVNAPRIFAPMLEIVKRFLSKATRESLCVYGPNIQEWQPKLLQMISEDQLPVKYGGTMKVQ